jgi:hypothetical protein
MPKEGIPALSLERNGICKAQPHRHLEVASQGAGRTCH